MKAPGHLPSMVLLLSLVLATFTVFGCSKDKKDEADAAADAAPEAPPAAVADAAPEAAVVVLEAGIAPLATTVAPRPVVKAPPPDPPICVSARAAKKRGSPAAPGLEAQCKAAGGSL